MKYSLQCKYSMIDETFLIILKSMQNDYDYQFQWQIKNIQKPVWFLTNNNMVFKAQTINDLVEFKITDSKQSNKSEQIYTTRVPILTFESNDKNIEIIYDFLKQPNNNDKIIAEIVHQVINSYGGGFLQSQQEYAKLQKNIQTVLIKNSLIKQQIVTEVNTEIKEQKKVKTVKPKRNYRKKAVKNEGQL